MKQSFQFVVLYLLTFSIYAFEVVTHEELSFFPRSIIVLPDAVNGISWSESDYFAISESKYICFALNEDYGQTTISSPGGDIRFIKFGTDPKTKNDSLLILTENNVLGIKTFAPNAPTYVSTKTIEKEIVVNSIDFSSDGNYILLGLENGEVHLLFQLFVSKQFTESIYKEHQKGIYSVSFSPDSKYFLSAGDDKVINIWSAEGEKKKLYTLEGTTNMNLPVLFTADSTLVVSPKSKHDIIFRDFAGNVAHTIHVKKGSISQYSLSKDSRYLFALTSNNKIMIYDIATEKQIGYVPAFNKTPITEFEFNKDESRLIVGHKDGTVFYLRTDEVVLNPDAKPPKLGRGPGSAGGRGLGVGEGSDNVRKPHSIEIRAEVGPESKPYVAQTTLLAGYTNAELLKPIYFGGLIKGLIAYPSKEFPNKYYYPSVNPETNEVEQLPNPLIEAFGAMMPIGFALRPFGNDVELFAEVQAGFSVYTFYFPKGGFVAKFFPAFTTQAQLGAAWRGVSLYIGGAYDTKIGFTFSGGLGFRYEVGKDD